MRFQNSFWSGGQAWAVDAWAIQSTASTTESCKSSLTFHSVYDSYAVRMGLTSDGYLGINVAVPLTRLDVGGDIHIEGGTNGNGYFTGGRFILESETTDPNIAATAYAFTNTSAGLIFRKGTVQQMILDTSGNLGITTGALNVNHIGEYTSSHGIVVSNKLTTLASATGGAGFNLPHGAAPSSPVNGDIWTTSAGGLYVRINGTTVGPLGGVTPTDNILDWDAGNSWYAPYTDANKAAGRFYTLTSTYPSNSTALAYDGVFYVSSLSVGTSSSDRLTFSTSNTIQIICTNVSRLTMTPAVSDSGTAMAYTFDTANALYTTGAKLFSILNHGTEKANIDYTGTIVSNIGFVANYGITGTTYITYRYSFITAYVSSTSRMDLQPSVADGASAIAYKFDTHNALSTSGALLVSVRNQGVQKFSVDCNGLISGGNIYPIADDTYYLGKNSISTPLAWKGVILKDTTNGNYYRITVVSGTVTATQIT
jgi:hypothetical protein